MEFHVLGPLEVVRHGRTLELGAGKQRTLLAVLLLHANEVVSTDRLIDALWGEQAPATAPKIVQGYVSRLRKVARRRRTSGRTTGRRRRRPADPAAGVRPPGRGGTARRGSLRGAARAGRGRRSPAGRRTRRRRSSARRSGSGAARRSPTSPSTRSRRRRSPASRSSAWPPSRNGSKPISRSGVTPRLVAELEALVARHPLRERLRGQLMLALYRCGRQAEALQAYQDTRRVLVDELGLEPSRAIVELEQAILRQDPASTSCSPRQPSLRPRRDAGPVRGRRADGVFVGRERELAALVAALGRRALRQRAARGRRRRAGNRQEPPRGGAGEPSACERGGDLLGARMGGGRRSAVLALGAGASGVRSRTQLRPARRRARPRRLRDRASSSPRCASCCPALGRCRTSRRIPSKPAFASSTRSRAFLRGRVAPGRSCIVLDDLNWADEGSLLLLEFVARELAERQLLLVGTYRDIELSRGHPLAQTLGELSRERPFERLVLRGLAQEDVARFVEAACGFAAGRRRSSERNPRPDGGQPVLRRRGRPALRDEGVLTPESVRLDASAGAGESPRASARSSGDASSASREPCSSTLTSPPRSVASSGSTSSPCSSTTSTRTRSSRLLDEALAAHLVEELPGTAGRYQFTHALIQATLADELSRTRRARLHARIAEALETLYGADADDHAAELAHHFGEAQSVLGTDRLVRYCALAGESALAAHAPEQALAHFERALAAKGGTPTDDQAAEVLFGLGRAQLATLGHDQLGPR